MDQVRRKTTFEVRTLCLVAALLLVGTIDTRAGDKCGVGVPDPQPPAPCPGWEFRTVRPIPTSLAELTGAQVQSLDIAMRELRARRRDWKLYGIALMELDGAFILSASRPDDPNFRELLYIEVNEKTFRVEVTDYRKQGEPR